jgi:hypothetical protein
MERRASDPHAWIRVAVVLGLIAGTAGLATALNNPSRARTNTRDGEPIKTEFVSYNPDTVQAACEAGIKADLDGDGRVDEASHTNLASGELTEAVLALCLATGEILAIGGIGQAEGPFEAIDSNHDGRPELFYGATTACSAGGGLAVVDGGRLVEVTSEDGTYLLLEEGCDGPQAGEAVAFGCLGEDLAIVHARPVEGGTRWTRHLVHLDGVTARTTRETSGLSHARRVYDFAVPDDVEPQRGPTVARA